MRLYAFVRRVFQEGGGFMQDLSDPVCYPLHKAIRHMNGELEKLRASCGSPTITVCWGRSSSRKTGCCHCCGTISVTATPTRHFSSLTAPIVRCCCTPEASPASRRLEHLELAVPDDKELQYRRLWKTFFETVAIPERKNPRCQDTFLPKRYRGVMTEFLPAEYEKASGQMERPQLPT